MKEVRTIRAKFNAMCEADGAWKREIAKTLTSHGHPFYVADDMNEQRGAWYRVIEDDRAVHCTVDMVKCENGVDIYVHKTEWDHHDCDEWIHINAMGDAEQYILEDIVWAERDDLMHIASDNHDGMLIDIMNCSNVKIYFMEIVSPVVEEVVNLDDYENMNGAFYVHRYEWSQAMKDLDMYLEEKEDE